MKGHVKSVGHQYFGVCLHLRTNNFSKSQIDNTVFRRLDDIDAVKYPVNPWKSILEYER